MSMVLPAQAEWALAPSASQVGVTITERTASDTVAHRHRLRGLDGQIADDGTLRLPLRLSQLEVLDRFDELPAWLAGLADKPLLTLSANVDTSRLDALTPGSELVENVVFQAQGQQAPVRLRFSRLDEESIRVTQAEPLSLDAREVRSDPVGRSVLALLGYDDIRNAIPVSLDARLVRVAESTAPP
ncbi:hypothetical protein P1P91_04395 [Halomonas piscis]|uniref:Lipid/polyisoprenoid-binding YceI-like domain-containing protein n=2 Tax=Halomonas piscis TaxID=3031727 RepID=A0ABY9Z3U0_9GAMM|nr:hypothetical protein [Halomonas piscis]WNK20923.1 hypothetical protein P1P91_04395 [Halomonas piscis]